MNVETCGHVAELIVMAHAFAELRDGVVARQHEERFQMWAQFRSNPLQSIRTALDDSLTSGKWAPACRRTLHTDGPF